MLEIWLFCNSLTTGRTAFVSGFVSIMTGFFFILFLVRDGGIDIMGKNVVIIADMWHSGVDRGND